MDVDLFLQHVESMKTRLEQLYQGANNSVQVRPELLPVAFKELGIASEELQIALEELQRQNQQLLDTQAVLKEQFQRYQEMFDFAPEGYIVTDAAGTIQEANRNAAAMVNISSNFLVGKPLITFIAENQRQKFRSQLNNLQQTKQAQRLTVSLTPRNGESFEATLTIAPLRYIGDTVVGLRVCICEISDTKRELHLRRPMTAEVEIEHSDRHQDCQKQLYLKGEIIPLKRQTIWQVCQGVVKLSTLTENGEEVLVGLAVPSMVFSADLTSLQTYQAVALSDVELVSFSLTDIFASPQLAQTFLPQISQRLKQTEALLAISGKRLVKDRLHSLFLLLKQELGQPVGQGTRLGVRLTHQEFADACSTTRVTITRLLGKLQAEGKIIVDSKNHIILKEQYFHTAS